MRDLTELKQFRRELAGFDNDDPTGGFYIFHSPVTERMILRVIATASGGWDHVSVSAVERIPVWREMEWIRRKFFKPEEFAFQYHAPIADYVDGMMKGNCATCLHLWRPWDAGMPIPPKWMVGGMTEAEAEYEKQMFLADRREKGLPI